MKSVKVLCIAAVLSQGYTFETNAAAVAASAVKANNKEAAVGLVVVLDLQPGSLVYKNAVAKWPDFDTAVGAKRAELRGGAAPAGGGMSSAELATELGKLTDASSPFGKSLKTAVETKEADAKKRALQQLHVALVADNDNMAGAKAAKALGVDDKKWAAFKQAAGELYS